MMKLVSGNADEVLNFLNTGHENIEFTIEKRYQKLSVLDILTTTTNNNRITNIYAKFTDTGSLANYLSLLLQNKLTIAKILVDWLYTILTMLGLVFIMIWIRLMYYYKKLVST